MKKIINEPQHVVEEMLQGIVSCYSDIVKRVDGYDIIQKVSEKTGQVALISGGGSGHEPAHAGFVGQGMLSAAVCGAVFTSPTPDQILEAIKVSDEGQGVLLIIKNYSGDIMNFELAQELAQMEGINVESIVVDDDIAVEDSLYTQGKRGVAGTILVHKILGYYAKQGKTLSELKIMGQQLVSHIKTIGLALSAATVPELGKPGFILADDEIEFGIGIHSEPGYRREKLLPSYQLAQELFNKIAIDFNMQEGQEYGLLINGLGGTPLMEQFIFANDVKKIAEEKKIKIVFNKVGNYMTSIDMQGLSLTVIKFENQEWLTALSAPVKTISW